MYSRSRGRAISNSSLTADYSNVLASENIKVFVRLRPPEDGSDPPPDMLEINRDRVGSMLTRVRRVMTTRQSQECEMHETENCFDIIVLHFNMLN